MRVLASSRIPMLALAVCGALVTARSQTERLPHVVFVTGDEEYRSEESMPLLASILQRSRSFRTTVLYALDPDGTINPDNLSNIPGLEVLAEADLMVLFLRFRQLPDDQLRHILDFAESGRPMVGFRTSTHAFRYPEGPHARWNDEFGRKIFGQKWITHHGHHGHQYLTDVVPAEERRDHPILRGVRPFKAYSWLYHVQGGGDELEGDNRPLLFGTSLISSHQQAQRLERYPLTQPVAWTRSYTGARGRMARVFFTTLGHPHDFRDPSMRRLAIQGIYWALGMEARIPPEGVDVELAGEFNLTNAGFRGFVRGMKPPRP